LVADPDKPVIKAETIYRYIVKRPDPRQENDRGLTLDQQKAIAVTEARRRAAEAQSSAGGGNAGPLQFRTLVF
jgi:ribosomal protein L15E